MRKVIPQDTVHVPRQLFPMLAVSSEPFDDPAFLFEIKWDGVRALTSITAVGLRVWGKAGTDYSGRYPELDALRQLPTGTILDGELVMLRGGLPDFHALMSRHSRKPRRTPFLAERASYVVFDLLYLAGESLLRRPLFERRQILREVLPKGETCVLCDGAMGKGAKFFAEAIAAGHEGVVAKRLISPYVPEHRSDSWKKIKQRIDVPCVIIGYRPGPDGVRDLQMATLIDGKLAYVGSVELGIRDGAGLARRLAAIRRRQPVVPCSVPARWVEPTTYCTMRFAGWRPGGVWRDAMMLKVGE